MYLKKSYSQGNRQKFDKHFPKVLKKRKIIWSNKKKNFFNTKVWRRDIWPKWKETGRVQKEIKRKLLNCPKDFKKRNKTKHSWNSVIGEQFLTAKKNIKSDVGNLYRSQAKEIQYNKEELIRYTYS